MIVIAENAAWQQWSKRTSNEMQECTDATCAGITKEQKKTVTVIAKAAKRQTNANAKRAQKAADCKQHVEATSATNATQW
jgi:hypothetical protein